MTRVKVIRLEGRKELFSTKVRIEKLDKPANKNKVIRLERRNHFYDGKNLKMR